MKTTRMYSVTKSFFLMLIAFLMILTFESCATKTKFTRSAVVPGAEGVVKVKKDKNENYVINIDIANLAKPENLPSPKNSYVVWMEGGDNETKNIGQIKSSKSMLSKSLSGSFETVSSVKPKRIFVTAENDPGVQYFNNMDIILTTNYLKN